MVLLKHGTVRLPPLWGNNGVIVGAPPTRCFSCVFDRKHQQLNQESLRHPDIFPARGHVSQSLPRTCWALRAAPAVIGCVLRRQFVSYHGGE